VTATSVKPKLLVADDDEEILRVVSLLLSKEGYQVIPANDGLEALHKARVEKPDAILLDIRMPGMDGLTVLEELNKEESVASIPVGFLTGQDDLKTYERARELGGRLYLLKPFSAVRLATFVGLLLGRKHD